MALSGPSFRAHSTAYATAWADSMAGMIPSLRERAENASFAAPSSTAR